MYVYAFQLAEKYKQYVENPSHFSGESSSNESFGVIEEEDDSEKIKGLNQEPREDPEII